MVHPRTRTDTQRSLKPTPIRFSQLAPTQTTSDDDDDHDQTIERSASAPRRLPHPSSQIANTAPHLFHLRDPHVDPLIPILLFPPSSLPIKPSQRQNHIYLHPRPPPSASCRTPRTRVTKLKPYLYPCAGAYLPGLILFDFPRNHSCCDSESSSHNLTLINKGSIGTHSDSLLTF
jgi:hypothetical protein